MKQKKQRPTAIKITNSKNITIKDNIGVGDIDLLDATKVENLDANGNVLINPKSEQIPPIKQWYETFWGKTILAVLIGLLVAYLVYYLGWS